MGRPYERDVLLSLIVSPCQAFSAASPSLLEWPAGRWGNPRRSRKATTTCLYLPSLLDRVRMFFQPRCLVMIAMNKDMPTPTANQPAVHRKSRGKGDDQ